MFGHGTVSHSGFSCRLLQLARSTARYQSRGVEAPELRQRLRALAVARPRIEE
jgi:hypothetical protein